ncbi:hypothetical protein AKUH4B402J_UNKNOWN100060 (plasmid) [Apilactobacillus kunkeei]|nr:hypothetical protein AKUH4B402J_UNKNOWN100060 [Apilactobacillus kunkeei]
MPKTVRELSNIFGVSKQAINKRMSTEFRRQHVTNKTIKGVKTMLVDSSGEKLLKQIFKPDNHQQQVDNPDNQLVVDILKEQVDSQKKELDIKNEQIKKLQTLLDQSQQLQLMSERKIEEIQKIEEKEEQFHTKKKWFFFRRNNK